MKQLLLLFGLLGTSTIAQSQCELPNAGFSEGWIHSLYINWSDSYDAIGWSCTPVTSYYSYNYYSIGILPATGSEGLFSAVEFNLDGIQDEAGIYTTQVPILCSTIPDRIRGHFKHTGVHRDSLSFSIFLMEINDWGDTTREVLTAHLVSEENQVANFKAFDIPIPAPHTEVFTQIDSFVIWYRSTYDLAGVFTLDDIEFGFTSATAEPEAMHVNISPTLTDGPLLLQSNNPEQTVQVSLRDMNGRLLQSRIWDAATRLQLDLSALPKGVYLVQGTGSSGRALFARRVMKG